MTTGSGEAEVRCICGKVKVRFTHPRPVLHVHCCCNDCRRGREWIASQGGPPVTQAVTLVYYFQNDLAPLGPEDLARLFTVKLRQDGRTTRLVSTCCHSMLALDHPYYEGNVVCVHSQTCILVASQIPPLGRIYAKYWDSARSGHLPAETAILKDLDKNWKQFERIIKKPVAGLKGVRLQDMIAQLPAPTVLGLPY